MVILNYSYLNVVLPIASLIIVSTFCSSICNVDSIKQSTPTGAIIRCRLLMYKNMLPKMRHSVFSRPVRPCVNCYVTQKMSVSSCHAIPVASMCVSVQSVFVVLLLQAESPGLCAP